MTRAIMVRHILAALVTALAIVPPVARADSGSISVPPPAPGPSLGRETPVPRVWTGTWEAAASGTVPAKPDTSIRNVLHISVGGSALRVRLSNRLGTKPLRLGAVTVALQALGEPKSPDAQPGSMRAATFAGARTVTIPAGQDRVTDTVALAVPAGANLLVTVHTPGDSGPMTYHRTARQTNFLAPGGNWAAVEGGDAYTKTLGSWHYVTGVDVLDAPAAGSVVALGDSLTDGGNTASDVNRRWPDRLADRLAALPPSRRLGVLNAGVSGNRVLLDGVGPSALARFDADVLSRTRVRTLIVFEGINDINGTPEQTVPSAFQQAYKSLVTRAHAHGIRVIGATITPYGGHARWSEAHESVRRQVNSVIRGSGLFDAVVDFDAAVRDPAFPHRMRGAYDSGDHLHFNAAGMRVMADSVDLADLRGL
ncbi:SGNH/GDSL hydrolase family protein [Streptomyces sp. ME02-8801-2C]|uniref:SGNH/GDSL hydrolase family protein n=1 Tax=Streptomyces sp. ME02-8801-2C TaxID=3028680 RepID=UPI0029A795FC|nr:SGNH/GDSL hydrolase family protein [Streptomyces sp. ME02-8801-2C]MDX3451176.1 SGNH/GDSL hydrolase family protein [Streptomyces sp. ME02-8801-2C]